MSDYEFEEEDFNTKFNGQTVWRLLKQAAIHWKLLAGFMIAIIFVSIFDSYFTYLSKRIIDEGILAGDKVMLTRIVIQYGLLTVVQSALIFLLIYLTGSLGEYVMYDLRRDLFDHLQKLSFSYFDRTPLGWIISRVTSDTQRVANLVTWGLLDSSWGIWNIGSALVFMAFINWRLTLIVMLVVPILVVVASQFQKVILVEYRKVRKVNSKITGAYNENITGVRVVKALVREDANLKEFDLLTSEMYRAGFRAAWLSALFLPVVQFISALAVGSVVWYGGLQTQIGSMTIGGIQAFISYITFMMWPIQEMSRVYAEMQQAIASGERIFSLLDAVPEIVDKPGAIDPGTIRGDIVFENVDFYYEADKPVLSNFNLHVRQGETIALVGPTGGGKSTLVNLVCRFYEPKQGRITIGGHDYTDLQQHAIHSRLGMVLQTPHLFSGSVRENIRYGRLDATDEEVEAVAKMAGAHDFIVTLEKGYDEDVGEGGGLLSVGQKQLISLARAILADPDIFIMDEATSSVDTLTEALIQRGMDKMLEGRTSFVIAHRLSTIRRADRILVIEDGKIVEMGSHAELIAAGGHYHDLYMKQFSKQRTVKFARNGHQADEEIERPLAVAAD